MSEDYEKIIAQELHNANRRTQYIITYKSSNCIDSEIAKELAKGATVSQIINYANKLMVIYNSPIK